MGVEAISKDKGLQEAEWDRSIIIASTSTVKYVAKLIAIPL